MRTYGRQRLRGKADNSQWVLVAKGLLKLMVVGMLIMSFREMALRSSSGESESPSASTPATDTAAPDSGGKPEPAAVAPRLVASGPTDEDPEEADAIREEFQAVTDATLEMGVEEMAAYNRVVRWVVNQPVELLRRRARKNPAFADFMHFPDKQRGKLVSLNLTIFRVRDAGQNEDGTQLYEAFGPTQESGSWLYWGVAVDLPPGMQTGPKVYEKVTFVGYFFKLQGYEPGDAKPNAKPLKMPLLNRPLGLASHDTRESHFQRLVLGDDRGRRIVVDHGPAVQCGDAAKEAPGLSPPLRRQHGPGEQNADRGLADPGRDGGNRPVGGDTSRE